MSELGNLYQANKLSYAVPVGEQVKAFTIGIVQLDYPDVNFTVGDVPFEGSYPEDVNVVMEKVKGFTFDINKSGIWNEELEREAKKTIARLEAQGANALIGDCGFLFRYTEIFARLTNLPVVMSAVNLLPVIQQTLKRDQKILILTNSAEQFTNNEMTSHINSLCIWKRNYNARENGLSPRLVVLNCGAIPSHMPIAKGEDCDRELMHVELLEAVEREIIKEPSIGAVLVECSMLAGSSNDIRRKFQIPVYDGMTVFNFMADSLSIMQRLEPKL